MLVGLGFACSAPKQYYMFNQKTTPTPLRDVDPMITRAEVEEPSVIILETEDLTDQVAMAEPSELETPAPVTEEVAPVMTKESFKALSRDEKKEIRREVRDLVKNAKNNPESVESTHALSGYTRIGVILVVAGIVLQVFSVLGYLGGILVAVGVILILLELLEVI